MSASSFGCTRFRHLLSFDIGIFLQVSDGSFILLAYTSYNGQSHVHERDVLMPHFRCIFLYLRLETMVRGFYIFSFFFTPKVLSLPLSTIFTLLLFSLPLA